MQNTEGQEKYHKMPMRQRQKYKPLQSAVQKQAKNKWYKSKNAYQDKVSCKTAIILQHKNFVLLS